MVGNSRFRQRAIHSVTVAAALTVALSACGVSRGQNQASGTDRYKVRNPFIQAEEPRYPDEGSPGGADGLMSRLLPRQGEQAGQAAGAAAGGRPPEIETQQVETQNPNVANANNRNDTAGRSTANAQSSAETGQGRVTGPGARFPYLRNYGTYPNPPNQHVGRNSNVPAAPNTDIGDGGNTFGTYGNPVGAGPSSR
jgi:hypothetical protein